MAFEYWQIRQLEYLYVIYYIDYNLIKSNLILTCTRASSGRVIAIAVDSLLTFVCHKAETSETLNNRINDHT